MDLGQILYAPIVPFVDHPGRIASVAMLFLALFGAVKLGRRYWPWPLLWTAGFWAAFALWEWMVLRHGEANIRVDLLVIYPILLGVTLWGLWAGVRPPSKRMVISGKKNTR